MSFYGSSSTSIPRTNSRPKSDRVRRAVHFHESVRDGSDDKTRVPKSPGPSSIFNAYVPMPGPTRRSSLPVTFRARERRSHAREALNGMRKYVKEACNFHGEHLYRALSVLDVATLSTLVAHVNHLRGIDSSITQRDEMTITSTISAYTRHPHELLAEDEVDLDMCPRFERYARVAHKKRQRRQAEHDLQVFVTRQLCLPIQYLNTLEPPERSQREIEAFKQRIEIFNGNTQGMPTNNVHGSGRIHSVPNSPLQRLPTAPKSPQSVPIEAMRRKVIDLNRAMTDIELEMGDLMLPKSSHDLYSRSNDASTLRRSNTGPYGLSQPLMGSMNQASHIHASPMQASTMHTPMVHSPMVTPMTTYGGPQVHGMQSPMVLPVMPHGGQMMTPMAGATFESHGGPVPMGGYVPHMGPVGVAQGHVYPGPVMMAGGHQGMAGVNAIPSQFSMPTMGPEATPNAGSVHGTGAQSSTQGSPYVGATTQVPRRQGYHGSAPPMPPYADPTHEDQIW